MPVSQSPLLAPDLSPGHGTGDHVIAPGNNLLLTVSWEERKGRKEKQQLVRSSTHAKKEQQQQKKKEIKGKDESEELVSFRNRVVYKARRQWPLWQELLLFRLTQAGEGLPWLSRGRADGSRSLSFQHRVLGEQVKDKLSERDMKSPALQMPAPALQPGSTQ